MAAVGDAQVKERQIGVEEMKIKISTGDGEIFEVDKTAMKLMGTVQTMYEDLYGAGIRPDEASEPIPLPLVKSDIMKKIIIWVEHHKNLPEQTPVPPEYANYLMHDISDWEEEFFRMDQGDMFDVILAANYLNIKWLLDVGCKLVSNMIKGKNAEQIRALFDIENDFTPEEEAAIRRENDWCEDRG